MARFLDRTSIGSSMILQDFRLIEWAKAGNVHPYDPTCINPASIDLRLGWKWRDIERPDQILYQNHVIIYPRTIITDMYNALADILDKPRMSTCILATTFEWVYVHEDQAGSIKLKTTPSRKGLGHPIADWVDPGFKGQLTLMLHAHKKMVLHSHERIVQLVIFQLNAPVAKPYEITGHYFNQSGPTLAWDDT